MNNENTETMSRFTTSDIFNTNKLSTDEIIRIGKDYANIDTWHDNQYFTAMLLVGEIERLKEEVEKAYQKGYEDSKADEEFESNCQLYDALDSYG